MSLKKNFFTLITAFVFSTCICVNVFASNIGSGTAQSVDSSSVSTGGIFDYSEPSDPAELFGVEKVSTEEVADKLNEKGNDIINLMQVVGRYVCYGAFIVGLVMMLAGCVGNKKMIVQGLIAVIIAGVCYAGIVCGRDIVTFIASWAAS